MSNTNNRVLLMEYFFCEPTPETYNKLESSLMSSLERGLIQPWEVVNILDKCRLHLEELDDDSM